MLCFFHRQFSQWIFVLIFFLKNITFTLYVVKDHKTNLRLLLTGTGSSCDDDISSNPGTKDPVKMASGSAILDTTLTWG